MAEVEACAQNCYLMAAEVEACALELRAATGSATLKVINAT